MSRGERQKDVTQAYREGYQRIWGPREPRPMGRPLRELTVEEAGRLAAPTFQEIEAEKCPDALLPDGPVCPRCGGERAPSGVDGGSWVHFRGR